jgi:hypothetical protein
MDMDDEYEDAGPALDDSFQTPFACYAKVGNDLLKVGKDIRDLQKCVEGHQVKLWKTGRAS